MPDEKTKSARAVLVAAATAFVLMTYNRQPDQSPVLLWMSMVAIAVAVLVWLLQTFHDEDAHHE